MSLSTGSNKSPARLVRNTDDSSVGEDHTAQYCTYLSQGSTRGRQGMQVSQNPAQRGNSLSSQRPRAVVSTIRTSQCMERSLQDIWALRKRENCKKYDIFDYVAKPRVYTHWQIRILWSQRWVYIRHKFEQISTGVN